MVKRKAFVGKGCVACGHCMSVCRVDAINVMFGIASVVDKDKCVGCGKCAAACPASVINMVNADVK